MNGRPSRLVQRCDVEGGQMSDASMGWYRIEQRQFRDRSLAERSQERGGCFYYNMPHEQLTSS